MSDDVPGYLAGNVAGWQDRAAEFAGPAEAAWASEEPYWGIWELPERDLGLLPDDMSALDAIELGCGAGYVSAWMHRRGARVTGIDPTANQLATARRLQRQHGIDYRIEQCGAERLPFPDASFDFAISEYGACLWADPYLWLPEAARVLRPGGRLVFLTNTPLSVMCLPDTEAEGPWTAALRRPYFGLHVTRWPDAPGETEFHLPHGRWIGLLNESGFIVERLLELQAPADAATRFGWADPAWASRWPSEEVWFARRRSDAGD